MGSINQKAFPQLERGEVARLKDALREKYKEGGTPTADSSLIRSLAIKFFDPKKRVLDVGCANGSLLGFLNSRGYPHTYGADIEDFLTKGRPTEEFRAVDLNFELFPWPKEYFQGVSAVEIYEHLENPFHFVREVARVLGGEGVLILTTPNPHHLFNKLSFLKNGEFYRFSEKNDHITLLTPPVFRKCILKYFTLVETRYWEGEFPYRWFSRFRWPQNRFFGRSVVHVLRKKLCPAIQP
ncbi:MAG: hypothetical protein A3C07_02800 [Candidatus Sungbacteria bacterium RIFCSPHIGHO2_02_FULL_47_11]|uniref:Methyltransferase type 11 domain-containing protein n=1 Tax=Candidatus Sungbacteria bacterium RIFCSPHIGHO2_02_FULL_47_11 TaxID=1802270 RepID=A0A1G2KKL7_9BACT|nr:MAG: hypothetical protein A3C07_02800 [Candidatus Sungbacteria bacterium RIFCSPHIGHO2_02_FULL_47_11]